jgi:hypothetical protein
MFPGEHAIAARTLDGQRFSMFAPADIVDSDRNLLRVDVIDRAPEAVFIYLPVSPIEISARRIKVDPKAIVEH